MSDSSDNYDVQVDWQTVVPQGDALAISTDGGFDDRWVGAFEIVLDEHERHASDRPWSGIDFTHRSDEEGARFLLFVRGIEPEARSFELRRTIDDLVQAANTVAQVGTHVYELARELRAPESPASRGSVPPPSYDPLADELSADAA